MSDKKGVIGRIRSKGEAMMNDFTNELLGNPKFAAALGAAIRRAMSAKQTFDRNLQVFFNAMNLPSKGDYERLLKRIDKMNQTVAELESRIDGLVAKTEKLSRKKGAVLSKPANRK